MKYLGPILGLATASNAIDIRFWHQDPVCKVGTYTACVNAKPNVCCYLPAGVAWGQGVSYEPLPLTWKLEVRMYRNGNCNPNAQVSYPTYGFSDECIPAWLATPAGSAGYGFLDKIPKRDSAEESTNSTQACTSRQQVDTMGFADGSQYNITGFSADMYTVLLDFAAGNKRMAELPEEFRALRLPDNDKESNRVKSS